MSLQQNERNNMAKYSWLQFAQIKKKTISSHFEKVTSKFKVAEIKFSEYLNIRWISKRLFWATVYLCGIYLTISSTVEIIQEYRINPVVLKMKAALNQETILVPNMTVCINFNTTTLFDDGLWSDAEVIEAWTNFTEEIDLSGNLDDCMSYNRTNSWSDALYSTILRYSSLMYEVERGRKPGVQEISHFSNQNGNEWLPIKDILMPKIAEFNITFQHLKSVLACRFTVFRPGSILSYFVGYRGLLHISEWGRGYGVKPVDELRRLNADFISFVSRDSICYQLNGYTVTLVMGRTKAFGFKIFDNEDRIFPGGNRTSFSHQNPTTVTVDFTGRSTPPDNNETNENGSVYYLYNRDSLTLSINVTALKRSLPTVKGHIQCSSTITKDDCENECRSIWIRKYCGCAPLTFKSGQEGSVDAPNVIQCTPYHYEKCLINFKNETEACIDNCVPLCEQWHYIIDEKGRLQDINEWGISHGSVFVQIFVQTFDYIIFEERLERDFEDFIGDIGGSISIWLGLDFIILINFVVYPMMMAVKKLVQKHNKDRVVEICPDGSSENEKGLFKKILQTLNSYGLDITNRFTLIAWTLQKLFWAIVYSAGFYYTFQACYNLSDRFLRDETVYQTKLMMNESILLPPATFCLSIRAKFIRDLANLDNGSGEMVHSNALTEYFHQPAINRETFLQMDDEHKWPLSLCFIAYVYCIILADIDTISAPLYKIRTYDSMYQTKWDEYFSTIYKYHTYSHNDWEWREIEANDLNKTLRGILEPKLIEWNVPFNQFRQKLGYELSQLFQLKLRLNDEFNLTDNSTMWPLTAINEYFFCYQLPTNFLFHESDDYFEISLNYHLFPDYNGYRFGHFNSHLLMPEDVNSVGSPTDEISTSGFWFTDGYGELSSYSLGIASHYKSLDKVNGAEKCSTTRTKEQCKAQCRITLIEKYCNCTPTYWSGLLQDSLKECSLSQYEHCAFFNNIFEKDDTSCKLTCVPSCEQWNLLADRLTVYGTDWQRLNSENMTDYLMSVRFSVKDYVYPMIEEQILYTWQNFLISLGGTLGLFLGLSVLSYINILLFLLKFVFELLSRKKPTENSAPSNDNYVEVANIGADADRCGCIKLKKFLSPKKLKQCTGIDFVLIMIKIITSTLFLAFLCVTIFMSSDLFRKYKAGKTMVNLNLTKNDSIAFPPATICLPFRSIELQVSNRSLSSDESFSRGKDKQALLNSEWPSDFLQLTLDYLTIYMEMENGMNLKESKLGSMKYNFTRLEDLGILFDNFSLSFDELKQKSGAEVRKLYRIDVFHLINSSLNATKRAIEETTFISESKICFKLPHTVVFRSKFEKMLIMIDRGLLPNPSNSSLAEPVIIDLIGRDVSIDGAGIAVGSTISLNFRDRVVSKLTIGPICQFYSVENGAKKCLDEASLKDCLDDCRIDVIQSNCNCTPVTWPRTVQSKISRCTLRDYQQCQFKNMVSACRKNCPRSCTRIRYHEVRKYGEKTEYDRAEIAVSIISFEYILFVEEPMYSFADFVSELGGILGLWIGLDFLNFVQMFYGFVIVVLRIFPSFQKRTAQESPAERH